MALALAALLMAPVGSSATAHAAGGDTSYGAPTYHDPDGNGEGEGEDEGEGEGEGEGGEGGSLIEVLEGVGDLLRGVAKLVSGED